MNGMPPVHTLKYTFSADVNVQGIKFSFLLYH